MKIKNKLFTGALTISIGAFLAKLLGALYRIPLTNIIGTEAIGLYQMVFPLYCILLTISSTGIPNSLAKIISEKGNAKGVLITALRVFVPLGVIGTLVMLAFGYPLAFLQGNIRAGLGYLTLAPSVFLTSIISCFRGYFQGKLNMTPTSISQVIEQLVKLLVGLAFGFAFKNSPTLSAGLCALAVTVSELVTVGYLYYLFRKKSVSEYNTPVDKRQIVKIVVPVTLSSMLIPLSRVADSFMILNILKKYLSNATSIYGIYTGGVESVIGVPVAICYGFAVAGIPLISSLKVDSPLLAKKKSTQVFFYTAFLGVVFTILVFLFSELIVKVLYFNLSLESKNLMANLIRVASVSILALALLQTTSAILVSFGRLYTPCITLSIGVAVKIVISLILLPKPSVNIYATAISDIVCYALALLLNSYFIFKPV